MSYTGKMSEKKAQVALKTTANHGPRPAKESVTANMVD